MSYNIPQEIQDLAEEMALDLISTGGGCDYIYVKFHNGMEAILTNSGQDGSPSTMDEKATIMIFSDSDWAEGINIEFNSVKEAMVAMATMSGVGVWLNKQE